MQINYPYLPTLRALVASARMQNHLGVQAKRAGRPKTAAYLFAGARAAMASAWWYRTYMGPH